MVALGALQRFDITIHVCILCLSLFRHVHRIYGASGPGGKLRHNIQRAHEALRKRRWPPLANGLNSTKAILSRIYGAI